MKGEKNHRGLISLIVSLFLVVLLAIPEEAEAANLTIAQGSTLNYSAGYGGETIKVTLTGAYTSVSLKGNPSWITGTKNGSQYTLTVSKNTGSSRSGTVEFLDGSKRWTLRVSQAAAPPKTVKVTFNTDGGSSVSSKNVTPGSTYGTLPTTKKTGYTFDGWFTAKSGGINVSSYTKVTASNDHTLYAHWTVKTIKVSFDSQGGSSVSSKSVKYGNTYGSLATPSQNGYKFQGWYTAKSGGSKVTSSTKMTSTSDHTLYAHWTANPTPTPTTITVSFDVNGGSGSVSDRSYIEGNKYESLPAGPTPPTGYEFAGWYTEKSGGTRITVDTTVSSSVKTLYAQYKGKKIKVTFNSNGGSDVLQKSVTFNEAYGTLETPKQTGYTFAGWYTAKSGGSKVEPSTIVKNAADHTLYARWDGNTYSVSFDSNGGEDPGKIDVTFGKAYGKLPTPKKKASTFRGWYTAKEGGTEIREDTKVNVAGAHTLYAHWKREIISVKFDSNGGYGNVPSKTYVVGEEYGSLPASPAAPLGKYFKGWFTAKVGGVRILKTSIVYNTYTTLYAQYADQTYTVTFDSRGGSYVEKITVNYMDSYGSLPVPKKNFYTFLGWYTEQSGGTMIKDSDKVTTAEDHMLYAHWKRITVNVKFDNNGGSGNVPDKTYNYGDKYESLPAGPAPPVGYTFAGWYTEKSGGVSILPTTTVHKEYTTLYAHYKAKTYNITFKGNGGPSVDPRTIDFGQAYTILPETWRVGYKFLGWYTEATGGTKFTRETKHLTDGDQVLYAHWEPKEFTVTFDSCGGSSVSPKKVYYDSAYGDLPVPTRDHYTFLGWFTAKTGGSNISSKAKVVITDNQTLYAHWKGQPINVAFDSNGGYGNVPNHTYVVDETYGDLPIGPTPPAGYEFAGWYTEKTGGAKISKDSIVSPSYPVLYAHWAGQPVSVRFDSNGGFGNVPNDTYYVGKSYGKLPAGPAPQPGMEFDGWFTKKVGGDRISVNTMVSEKITTLYAQYKGKTFHVYFKSNGGDSVEPKTVTFGKEYGELPVPNRPGYDLTDWLTEDGEKVTASSVYTLDKDQTLIAKWAPKTFTITFDSCGGVAVEPKTVTYGSNYGDLPNTSQVFARFQGWFTQPKGGACISSMSKVTITEDQTLYAHWKGRLLTVRFDSNGGDVPIPNRTYETGNTYGYLPSAPGIPENSLFDGWYTEKTGGIKITEDMIVSPAYKVLYAHYSKDVSAFFRDNPRFIPADSAKTIPYNHAVENEAKKSLIKYYQAFNWNDFKMFNKLKGDYDFYGADLTFRSVGVLVWVNIIGGITNEFSQAPWLLDHYFMATGEDYQFDACVMVNDQAQVTQIYLNEANSVMRKMEKYLGPGQRITFVDEDAGDNTIALNDVTNLDAFASFHGCSYGISGSCTFDGSEYTMDFYFYLQDYYDFLYSDGDWQSKFPLVYAHVGELAFLVPYGKALPFRANGIFHTKIIWKEGQKATMRIYLRNLADNAILHINGTRIDDHSKDTAKVYKEGI